MNFLRLPGITINLKYVVTIISYFDRYEISLASGVIHSIYLRKQPVAYECLRHFCEDVVDSC